MAEWLIASVLKTEVLKGTGGSNPSPSAKFVNYRLKMKKGIIVAFLFAFTIACTESTQQIEPHQTDSNEFIAIDENGDTLTLGEGEPLNEEEVISEEYKAIYAD